MTPDPHSRSQHRPSPRRRAASPSPRHAARIRQTLPAEAPRRPRATAARPVMEPGIAHCLPPLLLAIAFVAAVAVLSFPAARSASVALGWLPLWLVGMPLASVAALRVARGRCERVG